IRLNYENEIRNAGFFMPMVEQLGYTVSIDRFVIEAAITSGKKSVAINCSIDFIKDTQTYSYLDTILKTKDIDISFEIGSYKLITHIEEIKPFVEFIQKRGAQFGVDNLNENIQNIDFLQDIKPDYIKIDKQYILELADIDNANSNSLKGLMDSLDIIVIATTIENEESIQQLEDLDIEYFQGRYLDLAISKALSKSTTTPSICNA
ncbi:MAG: EAL domain-containing protein, partial [Campylobacterota bacterium]|nr:EAL domain-containing protein [Campylobacterota bacterium]